MKNISLFFFIFCIVIPVSFSTMPETITSLTCTNLLFNDSFPYSDTVSNHGWTLLNAINTTPLPSPFGTNAWGIKHAWSAGSGEVQVIKRALPSKLSTGVNIIAFNSSVVTYNIHDGSPFNVRLVNSSNVDTAGDQLLNIQYAKGGTDQIIVTNNFGGDGCNLTMTSHLNVFEWIIEIDFDENLYSIYRNKSSTDCNNRELTDGREASIEYIYFSQSMEGTGAANVVEQYIDDIVVCSAIGAKTCDTGLPIVFCDDFNYASSLFDTSGWQVITGGQSINATFAPISNKLNLTQAGIFYAPTHILNPFEVDYRTAFDVRVTQSQFSPVFSTELDLLIIDGGFRYSARDQNDKLVYILKAELESNGSVSWSYANTTTAPITYSVLCNNCSTNTTSTLKVVSSFANDACNFPFNSTQQDSIEVYMGETQLGSSFLHLDNTSCSANKYEIIKDIINTFIVDNYFVMLGTDKDISNFDFFVPLFDNSTMQEIVSPVGESSEVSVGLEATLQAIGLKTMASRTIISMLFIVIFSILFIMTLVTSKISITGGVIAGMLIIDFLWMILFVIVRMLPAWIIFLYFIIGGATAFGLIKSALSEGTG